MNRVRLGVVLLAVAALPAAAQTRFVCNEANFSIAAPAGWSWSASPASGTWSVSGPRGDRFTVHASAEPSTRKVADVWMQAMLPAITHDAAAQQVRIEHVMQAGASAPVFPSMRFAYTRVTRDGRRTFVDGYVAVAGRIYTIQYTSESRELLPEFWSFVRSFQVLDKLASQRSARAAQATLTPAARLGPTDVLGRPLAPNTGCGLCVD